MRKDALVVIVRGIAAFARNGNWTLVASVECLNRRALRWE